MTRLGLILVAIALVLALLPSVVAAFIDPDPSVQLGHAPTFSSTSDTWPREFVPYVTTTTPPKRPPSTKRKRAGHPWDALAQCEANGDWSINTGNGYSGGLQFHAATWSNYGGGEFAPDAWQATREQQIIIAERVLAAEGWSAWPSCSARLGLR